MSSTVGSRNMRWAACLFVWGMPQARQAAFPSPPMKNVKVWLDAGVTIERLADLPTAGRMKVEGGVASVHRKGKGAGRER